MKVLIFGLVGLDGETVMLGLFRRGIAHCNNFRTLSRQNVGNAVTTSKYLSNVFIVRQIGVAAFTVVGYGFK